MSRNRIRALYLQPAPLWGGAERQAVYAASLWPQFGVDVLPMVGPGDAIVGWLRERGVKELARSNDFPGGWPKQKGIGRATLPYRYLRCGVRARAEIERLVLAHGMDVIVASLPFAWVTGTLVARKLGIPIVWRAGGAEINVLQKAALWATTRVLRPDLLLCVGEAVRKTFAPLVPAPVAVVRNGVDGSLFKPGAGSGSQYRPADADCVVGCAERLTVSKRPQDFVKLAALLKKRFPRTRFLLAGEGSQRVAFERMAAEEGADNLEFLGFVTDMPAFYDTCDIVVLPSGAEGCPNVVLEAMVMGKAIVAAGIPPVLELVSEGENGLVYPLGDVSAFAEAVAQLIATPERRESLGAAAQKRARELTARTNAARIAALLKELVTEYELRRNVQPESARSLQPESARSSEPEAG